MNSCKRLIVTQELKSTNKKIEKMEASLEELKARFEETSTELAKYKELALEKKDDKEFKREFNHVSKKASKASEKYNTTLSKLENLKLQAKFYDLDLKGELHETHSDIMRYKNNTSSFWLCILAICFNVAMFLIIFKETNCTPDYQLGIDLLINICVLLAAFLLAEKTKTYDKRGGYFAIGLGVIELLRIFWIPLKYFINYLSYLNVEDKGSYTGVIGLNTTQFTWCVILLVCAALSLIGAGIICLTKGNRLQKHIESLKGGK